MDKPRFVVGCHHKLPDKAEGVKQGNQEANPGVDGDSLYVLVCGTLVLLVAIARAGDCQVVSLVRLLLPIGSHLGCLLKMAEKLVFKSLGQFTDQHVVIATLLRLSFPFGSPFHILALLFKRLSFGNLARLLGVFLAHSAGVEWPSHLLIASIH